MGVLMVMKVIGISLAKNAAARGVGNQWLASVLIWNDIFLDKLASLTGGSSMYVPRPQDIQHAYWISSTNSGRHMPKRFAWNLMP